MITGPTQTALLASLAEAVFELAEDLHDRSVGATALTEPKTAAAISSLGETIAILAKAATSVAKLSNAAHE